METLKITSTAKDEQFAKFGFETPEFECELWKKVGNYIVGYVVNEHSELTSYAWDEEGTCWDTDNMDVDCYKLNLLEKPWYEDESNFPKYLICDETAAKILTRNKENYFWSLELGFRPATQEEVLKLVVKE
jgi:hypothetical protein